MLFLRKSKKGFTLIELMVVVSIIGVLALLGLRLYTGQQQKAKNAIVKANAGTIQTLIQGELADATTDEVTGMLQLGTAPLPEGETENLFAKSGIHIPDGGLQTINGVVNGVVGMVYVGWNAINDCFVINGNGFGGKPVFPDNPLTARK